MPTLGLSTATKKLLDADGICISELHQHGSMRLMEKLADPNQSLTSMMHCESKDQRNGRIATFSPMNSSVRMPSKYSDEHGKSSEFKHSNGVNGPMINGLSSPDCANGSVAADAHSSSSSMNSEVSNACMSNSYMEGSENADSRNSIEFTQYFHEGYCKVSEVDDCCESSEVVNDADSTSSHCGREKQENGDNDDMLGGVFAFSEEGMFEI